MVTLKIVTLYKLIENPFRRRETYVYFGRTLHIVYIRLRVRNILCSSHKINYIPSSEHYFTTLLIHIREVIYSDNLYFRHRRETVVFSFNLKPITVELYIYIHKIIIKLAIRSDVGKAY